MNFNIIGRVGRLAAIGAILLSSASCVYINEELGENLIPTAQLWDVFNPDAVDIKEIRMQMSDSLSGYNTSRFTFGSIQDGVLGSSMKSTSFTLVPLVDTLDFGRNTKLRQFHFSAVRDTLSMVYDNQERILQNVYVTELKKPLDSTVLYTGSFIDPKVREEFLDLENRITEGIPVYNGGDSLSFDFSEAYALEFIERLKTVPLDSMNLYLEKVPDSAAVNEAANLAKVNKCPVGFVNGLLREFLRHKDDLKLPPENSDEYLSVKYSVSRDIVSMWIKSYGKTNTIKILESFTKKSKMFVHML